MRNIWLEFVRGVGEGWSWFWAPWRAVCALLDRITGAAHEIALLEQQLASVEFERDEYAKHAIVCSCCADFIPPGMAYKTQHVDGERRFKCEACCPRCWSCGTDLAEGEGTRRVLYGSNDPHEDTVTAVTCAACERGVWHCGGCGTAYEADVANCTDPACDRGYDESDEARNDCALCGKPMSEPERAYMTCDACNRACNSGVLHVGDDKKTYEKELASLKSKLKNVDYI